MPRERRGAGVTDLGERLDALPLDKRALLERRLLERVAKAQTSIPRRAGDGPDPLSFSQERLWFLDQLMPETTGYNVARALSLCGALDVTALRSALDAIVARHDVLRTVYPESDGQPVQTLGLQRSVELPVVDLSNVGGTDDADRSLSEVVTREAQRPFDLARDLMLRACLIRCASDQHMLLLVTHHIASDGWSAGILFGELGQLYGGFAGGPAPALPDLPIRYSDFAAWQREWLSGERLTGLVAYWKDRMAGAPPSLALPFDRSRPAVPSMRGARHWVSLAPELHDGLRALARSEGATPFAALLAGLQALLWRYTGQEDLIVGSPVAGRVRPETEGLVGLFVNTMPLRTDLSGNPTFRELLRRARATVETAFGYQDLPFEKLVEVVQPERNLAQPPLFQVLLNLVNVPRPAPVWPGLEVEEMDVDGGSAVFDLTLQLAPRNGGLTGFLEYSTDLFDAQTVARMAGHLEALLRGAVADPDSRLAELPMLSEAERRQLIVEWNATDSEYPRYASLVDLFEARATEMPGAVALLAPGRPITYRELRGRVGRVARALRARGVGPGLRVACLLERSPDAVAAILGILATGAAYVPVDPSHPASWTDFVLRDARVALVVVRGGKRASVSGVEVLDLAVVEAGPEPAEPAGPGRVRATDQAYVIYTSGSTGQPKGVVGLHRGVVNRLTWMWRKFPFADEEVVCAKTALGFVDSVWEMFGGLLAGVPTLVLPNTIVRDPRLLVGELAAARVTRLALVPSLLAAVLDTLPDLGARLPALRLCVSSGEALPSSLGDRFRAALPHCRLVNLYGSTEVSADVTAFDASRPLPDLATVPIGRPIANTRAYVLDPRRNLVPIGVPGELYLGGDGLSEGYAGRPDLTAERFVEDPFDPTPGRRLFRTGDLVRYLPDGNLVHLGRIDRQVKVRGCRVEPSEVEAALREHPGVAAAAVVASDPGDGVPRLVAYVVPRSSAHPGSTDLRGHLRARLPEYMVPSVYRLTASLPLTPSGKVDWRALPAPESGPDDVVGDAQPSEEVDSLAADLSAVWADVLRLREVGPDESFFELGGHSLLAVRLCARIERRFGCRLPISSLFEAPTVRAQAQMIRRGGWRSPHPHLVAIRGTGARPRLFCFHTVDGTVLHYRDLAAHLDPELPVYGVQADEAEVRRSPPAQRVRAMAAVYADEITGLQPEGPYYLCGYSAGGIWAFAVAQLLRARGHRVAFLGLIDTGLKPTIPLRTLVAYHLASTKTVPPGEKLAYVLVRVRRRVSAFLGRHAPLLAASPVPVNPKQLYWEALANYVPEVYPGAIDLFIAKQQPRDVLQRLAVGWRALARDGVTAIGVPGDHFSLLSAENVGVLTEELDLALRRATSGLVE